MGFPRSRFRRSFVSTMLALARGPARCCHRRKPGDSRRERSRFARESLSLQLVIELIEAQAAETGFEAERMGFYAERGATRARPGIACESTLKTFLELLAEGAISRRGLLANPPQ